ncbi:Dead end protein 1 [Dissostichus eleginoides]|uniref:Dead end protein 1 n=1 Tax=Dissostichus eleginoides TaxID=100907 RepID=A0AAD9FMJ9_DISEL|nr:Dead end protein 1 [Dissostichus eleginoides]
MPLNSAKQWENPLSPRPPPPSSSSCVSSLEGHLTPSGSLPCPMALLCELCEAKGVGKPHYDVKLSHAVPKGFMFFFYDVSVPGITLDFKGVVMILPGPSAYATLREAHQAVALQVLQKICNN